MRHAAPDKPGLVVSHFLVICHLLAIACLINCSSAFRGISFTLAGREVPALLPSAGPSLALRAPCQGRQQPQGDPVQPPPPGADAPRPRCPLSAVPLVTGGDVVIKWSEAQQKGDQQEGRKMKVKGGINVRAILGWGQGALQELGGSSCCSGLGREGLGARRGLQAQPSSKCCTTGERLSHFVYCL